MVRTLQVAAALVIGLVWGFFMGKTMGSYGRQDMWFFSTPTTANAQFGGQWTGEWVCQNVIDIPQSECIALWDFYEKNDGPFKSFWFQTNKAGDRQWIDVNSGHVEQVHASLTVWATLTSMCNLPKLNVLYIEKKHNTASQTYTYTAKDTSPIPSCIGDLKDLKKLTLDGLKLAWPIPASLGKLTNLTRLTIGGNNFWSALPSEIGNLSNLEHILIGASNLIGALPKSIWNLHKLYSLDLSKNNISGKIPSEIEGLNSIFWIDLHSNKIEWPLPSSIWKLSTLTQMYIDNNNICGRIPESFMNLNLYKPYLEVWNNNFITDGYSPKMTNRLNEYLLNGWWKQNSQACKLQTTETDRGIEVWGWELP